eukprot:1979299-Amphidinium_carterae.1
MLIQSSVGDDAPVALTFIYSTQTTYSFCSTCCDDALDGRHKNTGLPIISSTVLRLEVDAVILLAQQLDI